jgi:small-conductance mechanosensitive channel
MSGWLIFRDYRISGTVLVGTVVIVVVALIGSVFINRALRRLSLGLQPHLRLPAETLVSLARMLSSLLWLCAGLLVLELWGISVAGLWAVLASAAAVVGVGFLAVWTIISNITASLFIGIWHPFRLGESVEILPEGLGGRVIDRNLMFTVLRETSGATLQIPNNLFFQKMFRVWATDEQYLFEFLEKGRPSGVPAESSPAPEPRPAALAEKMPGP